MCELCVDQSIKHKDLAHKTLAHSTFVQILSQIANPLPKEGLLADSQEVRPTGIGVISLVFVLTLF